MIIKLLKIVLKGGVGSGNFGHAGIPGHVGGSRSEGGLSSGLRRGWLAFKNANLALANSEVDDLNNKSGFVGFIPYRGESVGRRSNRQVYEIINKQIDFLDALNQEELLDFAESYLEVRNGAGFDVGEFSMITSRLGKKQSNRLFDSLTESANKFQNPQVIASDAAREKFGMSAQEYYDSCKSKGINPWVGKAGERFDEMRIFESKIRIQFDREHGDENAVAMRSINALINITTFAEDDSTRRQLLDRLLETEGVIESNSFLREAARLKHLGVDSDNRRDAIEKNILKVIPTIAATSYQVNKEFFVTDWLMNSDTEGNAVLHSAIAAEFSGEENIIGYWNTGSLGIKYRNPDPKFKETTRKIYNETQDYYAKKAKKTVKLKRGVTREVTVSSHVESWTKLESVAKLFDGHAVYEKIFSLKQIFWSYESIGKPLWDDALLKGKKEYTILPYMEG